MFNLWTNSSFRVFKIAGTGNGGKICETVGLGFVKVEADALGRRADIVSVLERRCGEVEIFDSQLEMARVAHTLWQMMRRQDLLRLLQQNQRCDRREMLAKSRIWMMPASAAGRPRQGIR